MFIRDFAISFFLVAINGVLGGLQVVSDLTPEDCWRQNKNYIEVNDLPQCGEFGDPKKEICNKYYDPDNNNLVDVIYKPSSCNKDGTFGAIQCKGERMTGRCFCFDQNGYRIFGQQWWTQVDTMTCACSRKKAEIGQGIFYNSLHCNSMGNYEPLQCDVVSEQCWCVDEKTGRLKSPVVPQNAVNKLPCYNSLNVGTQYLRQCDNKKFAQKNIEYKLQLHGTLGNFGALQCDEDGAYGSYTVVDGLGFCTWRDNSKIGSWSSPNPDPATLNCNCARDMRIFADVGKEQLLKCGPTGNYQSYQGTGDKTYCIDPDGYRKSPVGVMAVSDENCTSEHYPSYTENH